MVKGLVDHLGRPLKASKRLTETVAGATIAGVRSVLSGHPEAGLEPRRLNQLMRAAESGDAVSYLELAEAMEEKDLHYLSVLQTRKRAVSQLPITVEAADESADAEGDAELVRAWLKRDQLEDELFDILDAIGKGYSVVEIVWETTASLWSPRRLIWRDPRWFRFDRVDGETLRLVGDNGLDEELEPFKYLVHVHKAKSGLAIRGGLARAAAWAYLFKNYAVKDWVGFAEIYGLPFRLGRYDAAATETDKRQLLEALAQMGADAAGIIPKTTEVEFVDGKGGSADGALFRGLAEYMDQQVSKAVLGQTATTDAVATGLGGGLGQVHNDVRGDIERADAKLLAATLNQQLVQPMVMLNRGVRSAYPRLVIGREESVDAKAAMEVAGALIDRGLEVPASWGRKLIRAPEPKAGEPLLKPAAAPSLPGPAAEPPETPETAGDGSPAPETRSDPKRPPRPLLEPLKRGSGGEAEATADRTAVNAAEPPAAPDAIDRFIGAQLDAEDGGWEALMAPVVEPLRDLMAEARDLEDARDRLIGLLDAMDGERLAELLARAGFNARLAGEAGELLMDADAAGGEA